MEAPKHDPLIEAAIRTIPGEEERRQAGAAYLGMLRGDREGGEAAVMERWELLDRRGSWVFAKVILGVLLTILLGWTAFIDFPGIYEALTGRDLISRHANGAGAAEERLHARSGPDQRVLLFGDFSKKFQRDRKEALHRSSPDNPAYYSEYAMACLDAGKPLPRDFLETVKRIDPDNAWFTYLAVAAEAKDLALTNKRGGRLIGGKGVPVHPVPSAVSQRETIDRMVGMQRKARTQGKYDTYAAELLGKRLAILPQDTRRQRQDSMAYLENNVGLAASHIDPVVRAVAGKAWLAVEGKDPAEMREVVRDAELLIGNLLGGEVGSLREELLDGQHISKLATQIALACDQLGLTDEAARWNGIKSRLNAWTAARKGDRLLVDGVLIPRELKTGRGVGFDGFIPLTTLVVNPPPLTDADIAPRRFLDHEHLSHFSLYLEWAALAAACVMLSLYRYLIPKVIRVLAGRMVAQVRPVDWAWVTGLGVLLPFFLVLVVNRFTPAGGRDYGITGSLGLLPMAHFFALLVLWLIVPVWVIHWRLGKRLRIFGFGNWNSWVTGTVVSCTVVSLFYTKWAAVTGTVPEIWVRELDYPNFIIDGRPASEAPLWIAAGLLMVPVLWLLYGTGAALLSATRRTLHRATAARLLIPVYAGAMALCLAAAPFYSMMEDHWFLRDAMNRFDPGMPSWSRYEYRIALQVRKELREAVGYDVPPLHAPD